MILDEWKLQYEDYPKKSKLKINLVGYGLYLRRFNPTFLDRIGSKFNKVFLSSKKRG